MKTLKWMIGIVVAFAVVRYALIPWAFPTYTLHYRLIVEAEDNGKIVTGESVVFVSLTHADIKITMGLRGEAPVVNFGERGLMFAVLRCESYQDCWMLFPRHFEKLLTGADSKLRGAPGFAAVSRLPPGLRVELPRKDYPLLVRFADINDPKTVERVDPDHAAASFGAGVRLTRIILETTKDPVTETIRNKMPPWFEELRKKGATLDGDTSISRPVPTPVKNYIGPGEFRRGFRDDNPVELTANTSGN